MDKKYLKYLYVLSIAGIIGSCIMGGYFNDQWYFVWFLFSVLLGNMVGRFADETDKDKPPF